MKTNRRLITLIGVITSIALIGAAGWYFWAHPSGTLTAAWNSLDTPAMTISSATLNSSGTVETTVISIAPELPGKVLEVDFQEGDQVKAGTVLVRLDDSTLKVQRGIAAANLEMAKLTQRQLTSPTIIANLKRTIAQDEQAILDAKQALDIKEYFTSNTDAIQSARSNLYLARVALNKAQTVYDKVKYDNNQDASARAVAYKNVYASVLAYEHALALLNLYTGVPNQIQVDLKVSSLELARARLVEDQTLLDVLNGGTIPDNATGAGIVKLQQARINIQAAQANLDVLDGQIRKMLITAPVDGVVMRRSVDPGNVATPGTELLSLARLNDLTITVYIPADSYGKIRLGQTANVSVDSFPGETFNAAVLSISDQPQFIPRYTKSVPGNKSIVYSIQLGLINGTGKVKPGMPADVSFILR
jgi:HlyD family secretion protein